MSHAKPRSNRPTPFRIPKAGMISSSLLAVSLVLSGCGGAPSTEPAADNSGSSVSVHGEAQSEKLDTAVQHNPAAIQDQDGTAGASAESTPAAATEPTASADLPAGAVSGSFATLQQACEAISAQMLAIAFAPMSYSYGGGLAEAKQAVSELPELRQKAPAGLQDDFARIEAVFAASEGNYTKIDAKAFKQAMDPVESWVAGSCPDL